MHNQRIALIVSAAVGIIATFLPFINVMGFMKISLIEMKNSPGIGVIFWFSISLIITLIGNHKNAIKSRYLTGVIITGVIPCIFLLLITTDNSKNEFLNSLSNSLSNFGIGFYLIILASLSILISGLGLKDNIVVNSSKEQSNTFYCPQCGKEQPTNSEEKFCSQCGGKL